MEDILYDYHLAQGMAEAQHGDIPGDRYVYIQKVYEKYGITQAEFDSSMVWYSAHAGILNEIYQSLSDKFENDSRRMGINISETERYADMGTDGDTARVWSSDHVIVLTSTSSNNLLHFTLEADTSYHKGDAFMLTFMNYFLSQDSHREGYAVMTINYENGKTNSNTTRIGGDYECKLNIPRDSAYADLKIKSLLFSFYLPYDPAQTNLNRVWVVTRPSLIRYHYIEPVVVDTQAKDSLADMRADSLRRDSATSPKQSAPIRMTPDQMRQSQPTENKVNIIKGRKVFPAGSLQPARPVRR